MINKEALNRAVNERWGYTQIAEENRCTVDEVKAFIETLSRQERRYFTKYLNSNERKYLERKAKRHSCPHEEKSVDTLRAERERLMEEVIQKEIEREKILDKRRNLKDVLASIKDEQLELQKKLAETLKRVGEISDTLGKTADELEALNSEILPKRKEIDALTVQIELLEKKTVRVLSDGNIETQDEIAIPDSWESYYSNFINSNEISTEFDAILEDLTRKEIKCLAKLVALTNMFILSKQQFEVIFENDNLQTAYSYF